MSEMANHTTNIHNSRFISDNVAFSSPVYCWK